MANFWNRVPWEALIFGRKEGVYCQTIRPHKRIWVRAIMPIMSDKELNPKAVYPDMDTSANNWV